VMSSISRLFRRAPVALMATAALAVSGSVGSADVASAATPQLRSANRSAHVNVPSRVIGKGRHAYVATGYGLGVDDATGLPTPSGCTSISTGTSAALAAVAVNATGGAVKSKLTVGSGTWTVGAGSQFSTVEWVALQSGSFAACLPAGLSSVSLQLLANTIVTSKSAPGGLFELSARIPLAAGTGSAGTLAFPDDSTPPNPAGVFLQVSSPTAGTVQLTAGAATVSVVVGSGVPAETVVVPGSAITWTASSGTAPAVVLLGGVTQPSDAVTGGSMINPLSSPVSASGTAPVFAGLDGIPAAGSQLPASAILANLKGTNPSVEDPLAGGRRTPTHAVKSRAAESVLGLADDGSLHLTAAASLQVVAWFGGSVVYGPSTVDLTLPGAPQPTAMPASNQLTFSGQPAFQAGQALILGVTSFTPTGAIVVVDSVSTANGSTTVTFQPGGLLDAFDALNLVSQVPGGSSKSPAPTPVRGGRRPALAPDISASKTLDFHVSKGFSLGVDPSVSGQLSFSFAPTLTVAINVNWGWSPSASIQYALDTSTQVSASISAQGAWNGSTKLSLGEYDLSAFDIGPVVVVPELSSELTLSAGIAGSVTVGAGVSEHSHDGFTLSAGGGRDFSNQGDSNNGFGAPQLSGGKPEVSVQATANANLSLTFTLAIYGEAGPYAEASANLGLSVNPTTTPVWQVTFGADFAIGINLNALDLGPLNDILQLLGIPSSPNWSLGHLSYVVGRGGTPSSPGGGGTGSPTPIGGNTGGGGSGSSGGGPTGGGGGFGGGGSGPAPSGASATVSQGAQAPFGYRYLISLSGFTPDSTVGVECYDSQDTGGFYWFPITVNGSGDATTQSYCYSADGPNYWVVADGVQSNTTQWGGGSGGGEAIALSWSAAHPGWVTMTMSGFPAGSYTYSCDFASGGDASFTVTVQDNPETFDNGETCYDLEAGDSVWVTAGSAMSNTITVGGQVPTKGFTETTGGVTNTWSDYSDAGGSQGPTIASSTTIVVTCAVQGFTVADGNTWWYQIASSPWSNTYYASADAFYNNGRTTGSLLGTPFVDPGVPQCSSPPPPPNTYAETVGGNTNTWTNYTDAGGTQGPTIPIYTTVQVTCALQGFRVADGNTWWYQIASSPWNNTYYASADAFYNNGQTSGSLIGTPFVDPNVPLCGGGITEYTGGQTNTWTDYNDAGGTQGPTIGGNAPVNVSCAVQGFAVADGNTWWYRISSPPWSNTYYASADAFYNNGQTSGSLIGTPFVDPNVPLC
jgi:hypothetical protein